MRFGVLGPIAAWDEAGRPVEVGAGRAAALLGLLLLDPGRPVSAPRLADQLWAGRPPATAATTLQGWVSRLRRVLEPGAPATAATVLVTRSGAYELRFTGLDLVDFRADVAALAAAGDPDTAVAAGRRALDRWRGAEPYGGLLDDVAAAETGRLREERLAVAERVIRARLDRGEQVALLGDLAAFTAEHPLREAGWAARVLALYRADRQAEALAVHAEARRRLADELGLDPGPTLRAVEAAVLVQDPAAARPGWWPAAPGPARGPAPSAASPSASDPLAPAAAGPAPPAVGPGGIVGRAAELAAVRAVLAAVRAGAGPAAVVVSGPSGRGKTALLTAALAGEPAVWLTCHPADGGTPYDLWSRLLAALGRPAVDAAPTARGWAARVAAALAGADPVPAVVLDDLQWADPASLRALALLPSELGRTPALLAATLRDDRPDDRALAEALSTLDRMAGERLALPPLAPPDVADYVRRAVPAAPAELADRVAGRSGGNAFFMTELVRLAAAGRSADELPDRVVDAVSAHAASLGEDGRRLLRTAAVLGDGALLDAAGAAAGVAGDRLDAAIDAAVGAGLLGDDPVAVSFGHALVRESLAARVTARTAAGLHRAYADAALAHGAEPAAVAGHLAAGRDPRAAAACLAAARGAIESAAFDTAAAWAERGLAVDPGSVELRLAQGTALRRAGQLERAGELLRRCHDEAVAAGAAEPAGRAVLELVGGAVGGYWTIAVGSQPGAVPLLTAARERPGLTDRTRAELDAALVVQLGLSGRLGETGPALAALRASAAAPAGPLLLAEFVARWRPDRAAERLELLDRLGPAAGTDLGIRLGLLHLRASTLLELGRVAESDATAARLRETAAAARYDDFVLLGQHWTAMRLLMSGRLAEALRSADEVFSPLLAGSVSAEAARVLRSSVQTIHGLVAWEQGRLPELLPQFEHAAPTEHTAWALVAAIALAQAGRVADSVRLVDRVVGDPAGLDDGLDGTSALVLLAEWAWEARARDRAAALLPRLRPWADLVVVFGAGGTCMGSGRLYTGSLAALAGDRETARADLRAAAERDDALGMPRYAERARRRLGAIERVS